MAIIPKPFQGLNKVVMSPPVIVAYPHFTPKRECRIPLSPCVNRENSFFAVLFDFEWFRDGVFVVDVHVDFVLQHNRLFFLA